MKTTEDNNVTVDEALLKTIYIAYRSPTGSVTRSEMTRVMLQKKLGTMDQRNALLEQARKQKLLNVGRDVRLGVGGKNPIVYRITKLGIDVVAPHVGDQDLEEHEQ